MRREDEAAAMPARPAPSPPPWAALPLVAPFLDAASLAAASCVSTSWRDSFAADHLWARLCRSHYPSALGLLGHLPDGSGGDRHPSSPHRRLFALFHSASARGRAPSAPRLALADVAFAVDVFAPGGAQSAALSFAIPADKAGVAKNGEGLFLFVVDVGDRNAAIGPGEWRVRWTAVRMGTAAHLGKAPAAVLMMDGNWEAGRLGGAVSKSWRGAAGMTKSLPAPGCGGARLEAEVYLELSGEEVVVEKVRLGLRKEFKEYRTVDEGLRYLQHFLL